MSDVLINFIGKTDQLVPAENALDEIVQKEKQVGEAWKKTSDQIAAGTKQSVELTSKLAKGITDLDKATKSMDKAVIGGAYNNYLKQIQKELTLTNKQVRDYVLSAKAAAQQKIVTDATEQEVVELTLSIELMNEQLEVFADTEEKTEKKTVSLKAQLKNVKLELQEMAEAGLAGTPAFNALLDKAGELDDQIKDVNATISNIGSDTRNIEGLIGVAQGVAGGFAVAQGAAALFGEENEDVQKALLKVNAAMAILQGLQQIQTLLQKESTAALFVNRIATTVNTTAMNLYSAATTGATATTRVFKAALVSTGIGAIVVALGFLIEHLMSAEEAQDKLNKTTDDYIKLLDGELAAIESVSTKFDQALQQIGAKESARIKAQGQSLADQINATNRAIAAAEGVNKPIDRTKEENDAIEELYEKRDKMNLELGQKRIDYEKQVTEETKDEEDKRQAAAEKTRALQERNAAARFEMQKRAIEEEIALDQKTLNDETLTYNQRAQALAAYLFHRKELLTLQENFEKSKRGLTGAEILNIEDNYNRQRNNLVTEGVVKRNEIYKQYNDRLYEQEVAAAEARKELMQDEINNSNTALGGVFNRLSSRTSNELEKELFNLQMLYDGGLISLEQYEAERERIKSFYSKKEIENNILRIKTQIDINKQYGVSTIDLEKQLNAEIDLLRQKDLEEHRKANKKKADDDKAAADKKKELNKEIFAAAITIAREVVNASFEIGQQNRENELNDRLNKLNQARELELSNKNLTEQQKAAIDKRYKKVESELRIKAFEQEKSAKRNQALMAGALAIIQAFAQLGPVGGAIAAGVIGITTALQIDKINRSTPPAGFKHGVVDLQGPGTETSDSIPTNLSKGESVVTARATRKWRDALEAMNQGTFDQYMSNQIKQFVFPHLPATIVPAAAGLDIDYELLATTIAKHLPEPTYVSNNIDEEGLNSFVRKGASKTTFKNKRYTL